MLKTTKEHTKYWEDRVIDWKKQYYDTWDHPHRNIIMAILRGMRWQSLWEIGVGGGANLVRILKERKDCQLGGSDVSPSAVEFLQNTFKGGMFHCESGENMLLSDNSVDVVLTDMTLIYVDPRKIDTYLKEMYRITRNNVILVEFHSESWWKRQLARLNGYHVYNYKERLDKAGFYGIIVQPIPERYWPGTDKNTEFRSIIVATKPSSI